MAATGRHRAGHPLAYVLAVAFWLAVWQALSAALGQPVLLPSPIAVLARLIELAGTAEFWLSLASSLARIALGFAAALAAGIALAAAAYALPPVRALIAPVVGAVRAAPVASFIILVLIWVTSRQLSSVISFLMAFPIIYTSTLAGLDATDASLLEMADVFGMGLGARVRAIYLSSCLPHLKSALATAIGFAWKAGVAAEVIGLPDGTIGEHLYTAKIFLDTEGVLAWTLATIALSIAVERLAAWAVAALVSRIERGA